MKKIIFVTGSTDGIGKLAAIKLVQEGHQVILHGRNKDKLNHTIEEIKSISDQTEVTGIISDLSEPKNIAQLSQQIKESLPHLDILVNNAGVYNSQTNKNSAGMDMRFAVNYFAPYMLTKSLIPFMKKSDDPRIINLSSAAQQSIDQPVLAGTETNTAQSAYAQSKLALTMWSFYLGQQHTDYTVIPVNPGSLLDTKMVREAFGRIWGPAEKGANIICDLALNEKHKGVVGKYFDNDLGNPVGSFGDAHADAYDQEFINELITITDRIISSFKS